MSWGERSCKYYGNCTIATIEDCNIFCAAYKHNGETKKRFNMAVEIKPKPSRKERKRLKAGNKC